MLYYRFFRISILVILVKISLIDLIYADSIKIDSLKIKSSIVRSGAKLKSGNKENAGCFSLHSIAAYNMGVARVDSDEYPDLFLCADHWHPGTFLYLFKGFSKDGAPIYSQPINVQLPFKDNGRNKLRVFENSLGEIIGFWTEGTILKYAVFNRNNYSFEKTKSIKINNLPSWPWLGYIGISERGSGGYNFYFTIRGKGVFDGPMRGADAIKYTAEGFWPLPIPMVGIYGAHVEDLSQREMNAKPLTDLNEGYYAIQSYDFYKSKDQQYILAGNLLGNIYAYPLNESEEGFVLKPKKFVVDKNGNMHRNPALHTFGTYVKYGNSEGYLVTSEGGIYYYKNLKLENNKGDLVFADPLPVKQVNADLYGGSLVVPELVDWNNDGNLDIISGTSTGEIFYFKNIGTTTNPLFDNPVALTSNDEVIKIQGGYRESIQGPYEARWGYTSPTVIDWNNDGLLDVLMGDVRGKFVVYLNEGTKSKPKLGAENSLFIHGMPMFGSWRVKPGIAKVGNETMYICLDSDDELHLYWRIDDYNLRDGGKLKLNSGEKIENNYQNAGAVGRSKISIVDWDNDGKLDLLIGVPKWGSIPNKSSGIPFFTSTKAATVVFLKNVGDNENPIYEYPKALKHNGKTIQLGGHECGVAVGNLGGEDSIIIGIEQGHFIYYKKSELSW